MSQLLNTIHWMNWKTSSSLMGDLPSENPMSKISREELTKRVGVDDDEVTEDILPAEVII